MKLLELLEPVLRFVYSPCVLNQVFRKIGNADDSNRLGKRELALRHFACVVRFSIHIDWYCHLFQTCFSGRPFVSGIVCGSFHLLDLLPTRTAITNIG